jgi:hypothetical protein
MESCDPSTRTRSGERERALSRRRPILARGLRLALLLLAVPVSAAAGEPPPATSPVSQAGAPGAALVDLVIAAHGGAAAIEGLHAIRQTGTLTSPMRGKAALVRLLERPGRLRVEIEYPGSREVRLLDGPSSFRDGAAVTGPPADAMALQAARLDLPSLLLGWRERVRDLGPIARNGRTLRALGLPLGDGLEVVALIDPATSRLVRSEGFKQSAAGPISFATDYSDFRTVGGVLFAFVEDNFASGQSTGQTRLEKIELLKRLPAETWKP